MTYNPHALYVNCDGAMDYGSKGFAGVGFVIKFPESAHLEDISKSIGRYSGVNIEVIEMEALIQAMSTVSDLYRTYPDNLKNVNQIILITDRFGLCDTERTNPYLIQKWRQNKWRNFEGKPIKNHEIIDKLDKFRKKLSIEARARVNIEYRPRKQNKIADKLAKTAKKEGLVNN